MRQKLPEQLKGVQEWISEWRDGLLQKPLLTPQKSLSYPKEIEVNRSTECNPFYLPQVVICILDTYISKKKSFLFWNRMSHNYSIMQLNLGLCTITSLLIKNVVNGQMWDALLRVECSLEDVSTRWRLNLTKDLKKRISEVSDGLFVSCENDLTHLVSETSEQHRF